MQFVATQKTKQSNNTGYAEEQQHFEFFHGRFFVKIWKIQKTNKLIILNAQKFPKGDIFMAYSMSKARKKPRLRISLPVNTFIIFLGI